MSLAERAKESLLLKERWKLAMTVDKSNSVTIPFMLITSFLEKSLTQNFAVPITISLILLLTDNLLLLFRLHQWTNNRQRMIISNHPDACTTDSEILDNNHKVDNLNLAIANCCSITNKQVELEQFLISHQVDIFLGTESHLDSSIFNAEVFPNHYNVYRKDRNKYGGGVFIIIRDSIPSSQLEITSPSEIIWVQLHTGT